MTNSSPWYRWPIENRWFTYQKLVIFHGYVKITRWYSWTPIGRMPSADLLDSETSQPEVKTAPIIAADGTISLAPKRSGSLALGTLGC